MREKAGFGGHRLRLFSVSETGEAGGLEAEQHRIANLLESLRIRAEVVVLPAGEAGHSQLQGRELQEEGKGQEREMEIERWNGLMRSRSGDSAVVFLYLSPPPAPAPAPVKHGYLSRLAGLTAGLPPCLLVRGVQPVVTAAL